ncbi:hypothetical protein AB4452_04670 [Vibrio lentus]
MEFPISGTTLLVDCYGNLYDTSTKSINKSEFIRIKDKIVRTKALIINTYIEHGRYDLLKQVDKPVYRITSPNNAMYISINLAEFCREQNLNYDRMLKAFELGHKTRDGWTISLLN